MQITIGQTSDDRRKVQKSFAGASIQVQLKQPCDILHPVFTLTWSRSYVHANYLYAPDLGRYYYIDNVIFLTGVRAEIHCSVDVLMSYADAIRNLTCTVARNADASKRARYVQDTKMITETKTVTTVYQSGVNVFMTTDGLIGDHYVLQVIGGSKGGQNT